MADIFLSYASTDRAAAAALAQTIEQRGWPVWWDRQIPYGKTFDEVIEENLEAAKCVIVLWTANSVTSKWVRTEASEGARRGILLPVLLQANLKIPLEFRLMQAADLSTWQPGLAHPDYDRLLAHIRGILGDRMASTVPQPPAEILSQRANDGSKASAQMQDVGFARVEPATRQPAEGREKPIEPKIRAGHGDVMLAEPIMERSEWTFLWLWLIANAIGWGAFLWVNELGSKPIGALIGVSLIAVISWVPASRLRLYRPLPRSWKIVGFVLAVVTAVAISVGLDRLEGDLLFLAVLGKPGATVGAYSELMNAGVSPQTWVWINGLTGFLCGLQGAFIAAIGLLWAGRYAGRQQMAQ